MQISPLNSLSKGVYVTAIAVSIAALILLVIKIVHYTFFIKNRGLHPNTDETRLLYNELKKIKMDEPSGLIDRVTRVSSFGRWRNFHSHVFEQFPAIPEDVASRLEERIVCPITKRQIREIASLYGINFELGALKACIEDGVDPTEQDRLVSVDQMVFNKELTERYESEIQRMRA